MMRITKTYADTSNCYFSYMIAAWGSYTFIFYAILDLINATMVFLFVKETRGKSIEEMETIFNSKAAFDVETARIRGMSKTDDQERRESVDDVIQDDDGKLSP